MKFEVTFTTKGAAIHMPQTGVGTKVLDLIREKTGVEKLDLSKIYGWVSVVRFDPTVEIPEEVARRSGHFYENGKVPVKVENEQLNPFVKLEVKSERNQETGEITLAQAVWELDREKVIEWWESEGFPLNTTDSE